MELPKIEIPALTGLPGRQRIEVADSERASVLVVDDRPEKAAALAGIVDGMGVEVVVAHSGREALRRLLSRDFALILLDVHMPNMDGYETAELIHGRPRSAYTPIIFITAEEFGEADIARGYRAGAVDWVVTPVAPETILAKVGVFADLYHLTLVARRQARELEARHEEIARQNLLLEEASRMKSEFLANMSHELRTPLNAINGFSELLRDGVMGKLTDEQQRCVVDIYDSGMHLLALIDDILDLSKIEAGRMTLENEAMEVAAAIQSGLTMLKEKAAAHNIRLTLEMPQQDGSILADPRKFKQMLFNLLSNAVKFSPDGGEVHVVARRVRRAEVRLDAPPDMAARLLPLPDNGCEEFLEVAVADNGIGIAAADLLRLFQTFVQLDATPMRRFEGTGLGLALTRRLAELHGGTIGVASKPEHGSVFVIWVPWRVPVAAAETLTAPANGEGKTLPPSRRMAGERVEATQAGASPAETAAPLALVIEDDDKAAELMRLNLESEGFRVSRAVDGEQGLQRAAQEKPALIVLDLLLPGLGGWAVLEQLKADAKLDTIPVVIASMVADKERGFALGAARVLKKPVKRAELHEALDAILSKRRRGQRPYTVLAVDDDPKALELVAKQLGGKDFQVVRAQGGREALASVNQVVPDLMVLDLMMPEVSGFDVVEQLKARKETAGIPILILTAKTVTTEDKQRLAGNVERIVEKSEFDRARFLAEVKRALGKNGGKP